LELTLALHGFGFGEILADALHLFAVLELPHRFLAAKLEELLFEIGDLLIEILRGERPDIL
jgi:hypothetical protein